jgi:hypothetical protein
MFKFQQKTFDKSEIKHIASNNLELVSTDATRGIAPN